MKVEVYEPIRVQQEYDIDTEEFDFVVYMGDVEVHRKNVGDLPPSYSYDYDSAIMAVKDSVLGEFATRLLKVMGE